MITDEEILKIAREYFFATTFGFDKPVIAFARSIIEAQKEKDALICEQLAEIDDYEEIQDKAHQCAEAIRSRK